MDLLISFLKRNKAHIRVKEKKSRIFATKYSAEFVFSDRNKFLSTYGLSASIMKVEEYSGPTKENAVYGLLKAAAGCRLICESKWSEEGVVPCFTGCEKSILKDLSWCIMGV